jgi:hypothetical protein
MGIVLKIVVKAKVEEKFTIEYLGDIWITYIAQITTRIKIISYSHLR